MEDSCTTNQVNSFHVSLSSKLCFQLWKCVMSVCGFSVYLVKSFSDWDMKSAPLLSGRHAEDSISFKEGRITALQTRRNLSMLASEIHDKRAMSELGCICAGAS
jgi:hypothetical protein